LFAAGFFVSQSLRFLAVDGRRKPIFFPGKSASMLPMGEPAFAQDGREGVQENTVLDEPEVAMTSSLEMAARDAKIAELKRLITTGHYETIEKLEDAVDAFLWSEHDRLQEVGERSELARRHPK
jgi:hypothetical protein